MSTIHYFPRYSQKQAEEELHLSEESFSKAFYSSPVAMSITTVEDLIHRDVNKSWVNMMGYSREEAIGKTTSEMGLWVNSDMGIEFQQELLTKGKIENFEMHFRRNNGGFGTGLASAEIIIMNKESCRLISVTDITERKAMEEKLRRSEKEKSNILESITDAFLAIDNNWTFTYMNSTAGNILSKICEIKKENLIGKNEWGLFPLYVETNLYHEYHRAIAEQIPVCFEFMSPYTKLYYEINAYPSAGGLSVYFRDISERKHIEGEMARLSKLNLIGEMAAGIAHEIRNPITTVRGFLQLLGGEKEYSHKKEYFNLMIEELDRANSIITEFLSLAKDKVLDFKTQNLNYIIKQLYPLIAADAIVNDKYLELELSEIPNLLLDEKEIRQLILNLVRNGLEAMTSGGYLKIKTFVDGDKVTLSVIDQGKGIDSQLLDRIGTPFFTTKDNGTGLGLATCYSIAARHNASIKIDTGPEGTTFNIGFKVNALNIGISCR